LSAALKASEGKALEAHRLLDASKADLLFSTESCAKQEARALEAEVELEAANQKHGLELAALVVGREEINTRAETKAAALVAQVMGLEEKVLVLVNNLRANTFTLLPL